MKIQLANRTYRQTNDCCLFCMFNDREYSGNLFRIRCTLPATCNKKAFSHCIFNDKIFKL